VRGGSEFCFVDFCCDWWSEDRFVGRLEMILGLGLFFEKFLGANEHNTS